MEKPFVYGLRQMLVSLGWLFWPALGLLLIGWGFWAFLPREARADSVKCSHDVLSLNEPLEVHKDPSGRQKITDVLHEKFVSAGGQSHFQVGEGALWARFTMQNTTKEPCLLNIDNAALEQISLYAQNARHEWYLAEKSGADASQHLKHARTLTHLLRLPEYPGENTYYLRIASNSVMLVPLTLTSASAMTSHLVNKQILNTLYLGLFIGFLAYGLFLFFTLGDRTSLLYAVYLLCSCLYLILHLKGFSLLAEPGLRQFVSHFAYSLAGLGILSGLVFSHVFLQVSVYARRWVPVSMLLGACCLLPLLFDAIGWRNQSAGIAHALTVVSAIYLLMLGVIAHRHGHAASRYYLIAWGQYLLALSLYFLMLFHVLPPAEWLGNVLPMASLLEMVLLSCALAHRAKLLQQEKLEIQSQNLKLIAEQNVLLEQKVAERTQELAHSLETVQQLNQLKDRLFSILAHDLRSPFTALKGALQMFDRKLFTPEQATDMIQKARPAINEVFAFLENLLVWAQTQIKGVTAAHPVLSPLRPLLKSLLPVFELLAEQKQLRLEVEIPDDLVVYADPDHVHLILRNLLSNAVKFTPKGGSVRVAAHAEGDWTGIEVSDTGVGIEPERLPRLFLPELQSTRGTAQEKGSGLGLALAQDHARANHGSLSVSSEAGKGTRFMLKLAASEWDDSAFSLPAEAHAGPASDNSPPGT